MAELPLFTPRLLACGECGLLVVVRADGTVARHVRNHRGEPCASWGAVVSVGVWRPGLPSVEPVRVGGE